jgi:hypothetical protein
MTPTLTSDSIRSFVFQQVGHWNAGRQDEFMALYRSVAPAGLTIEYVGLQTATGDAAWAALTHMWTSYQPLVRLQLVECIVNGSDAACYFRNLRTEAQSLSAGIETYTFRDGTLHLRVFH